MSYHQLTCNQRYQIERMIALGKSKGEIAKFLGVHRSTVYREIERNSLELYEQSEPDYDSVSASGLARDRRVESCEGRYKVRGKTKDYVVKKLKARWSPEQIAGRAKLKKLHRLSYSSIYRYIEKDAEDTFGEGLFKHLRRYIPKRKKRRKKRACHGRKGAPKRSIRERPKAAALRLEVGHYERDLMEGPRKRTRAVLVVVDRKSRVVRLRFVEKNGIEVQKLTAKILNERKTKASTKSMTNDNGSEFILGVSAQSEKELGVPIYFCDPCSPWQRGTVENTIGLLRQYIPKKYDFSKMTPAELRKIEHYLNNRPRKVLNYKTPSEIFLAAIKNKSL